MNNLRHIAGVEYNNMRSDMAKMICDCLRVGDKTKYRKHRRKSKRKIGEDGENLPRRESMRKWTKTSSPYGGKEFGEHLAPLHRYLEKQVNRPWNKVFSEICEHIKMDSTVQRHIREHVDMYVEQNAIIYNGKVFDSCSNKLMDDQLYVCPKSGLLKRVKKGKGIPNVKSSVRRSKDYVVVDDDHQIHQIKGIWYMVTISPVGHSFGMYDAVLASQHSKTSLRNTYGREGVYGSFKRQLNKKELRDYGLENNHTDNL